MRGLFLDKRSERERGSRAVKGSRRIRRDYFHYMLQPLRWLARGSGSGDSRSVQRRKEYPALTLERPNVLPAFTRLFRFYYITSLANRRGRTERTRRSRRTKNERRQRRRQSCFPAFFLAIKRSRSDDAFSVTLSRPGPSMNYTARGKSRRALLQSARDYVGEKCKCETVYI